MAGVLLPLRVHALDLQLFSRLVIVGSARSIISAFSSHLDRSFGDFGEHPFYRLSGNSDRPCNWAVPVDIKRPSNTIFGHCEPSVITNKEAVFRRCAPPTMPSLGP